MDPLHPLAELACPRPPRLVQAPRHPSRLHAASWLLLLVPLALYASFAFRDITLPGLYMDSVNPDYQAAWMLRGDKRMPGWLFRDNLLPGGLAFPLLNSLYGGNASAYAGVLFFSVTGFSAEAVRVLHALFGAGVLCASWWCLQAWRVPPLPATLALAALAVDPTFVFAWRTQHYLQLFPLVFLASGLALLGRHRVMRADGRREFRTLFVAGALLGFAAYGYFVFAFYAAAAIAVYMAAEGRRRGGWQAIALPLVTGAAAGWMPYAYAHLSIVVNAGWLSWLAGLHGLQDAYGVVEVAQGGLPARLAIIGDRLAGMVRGRGLGELVFAAGARWGPAEIATALWLALGPILLACARPWRGLHAPRQGEEAAPGPCLPLAAILLAITAIHLLFGLAVGRPLGLQHYVMLLPVLYLSPCVAAVVLADASPAAVPGRAWAGRLVGALAAGIVVANAVGSAAFAQRLQDTGGRGLYSDVINRTAARLATLPADTVLLFPQWGYWMGASMVTGPRFHMEEAPSLDVLQARLHTSRFRPHRRFAMVLGAEVLGKGQAAARARVDAFAADTRLRVEEIVPVTGRNGQDTAWIVRLSRMAELAGGAR